MSSILSATYDYIQSVIVVNAKGIEQQFGHIVSPLPIDFQKILSTEVKGYCEIQRSKPSIKFIVSPTGQSSRTLLTPGAKVQGQR